MKQLTLGEVAKWGSGGTPKRSVREYFGPGYPWLSIADLNDGVVMDSKESITPAGLQNSSAKLVPAGSIFVAMYGSIGKLGIAGREMSTSQAIAYAVPDPKVVNTRFLFHYLLSQRAALLDRGRGGTQMNIGQADLKAWPVPLPSLTEQQRIAEILDKVDALRAKRREAIAHLDSLGQSIFHEMFQANSYTPLGDLGVVQGGLQVTTKRDGHPLRRPYLRVANVFKGWIDTTSIKEMGVTPAEVERVSLQAGDLLFVEGHGNVEQVGRCAVWNEPCSNMLHQNHLIRYRPDTRKLLPDYVSMAVNTLPRGRSLQRRAKTTSGLNTITAADVRELSIPVAPLEEQIIFGARMAGIEKVKSLAVNELTQLDNLFLSVQDRAFKGEL